MTKTVCQFMNQSKKRQLKEWEDLEKTLKDEDPKVFFQLRQNIINNMERSNDERQP